MAKKRLYRIQFHNQGKVYQLYARRVGSGNLLGFVEIEGLVFEENSSIVIDPSEERLKAEFEGVNVIHVPLHAVIRIDEVDRRGAARILDAPVPDSNVIPYPFPAGGAPRKPD
jgi:hypothetical protein